MCQRACHRAIAALQNHVVVAKVLLLHLPQVQRAVRSPCYGDTVSIPLEEEGTAGHVGNSKVHIFVKPNCEGSAKGINKCNVVNSEQELFAQVKKTINESDDLESARQDLKKYMIHKKSSDNPDIGFEKAKEDWLDRYGEAWIKTHLVKR